MAYEITTGTVQTAKKAVIYGPEGIGKTTLAARFPDPLFIDTEHSTDAYDVKRFPYPKAWADVMGEVDEVIAHPNLCQTLVIDTGDWAVKMCTEDICIKNRKAGIEDFGFGKGYTYLAEEFAKLLAKLEQVKTAGVNVVITAHACTRKFELPDEMGTYDRWEMKMAKQVTPLVKEWADMILFCNYKTIIVKDENGKGKAQGGKRTMYTQHHACWDAKNRYGLAEEIPMEWDSIAKLFPASDRKAEPAPISEPESLLCEGCGKPIAGAEYKGKFFTVDKILDMSRAKFGKSLCWDCCCKQKKGN